MIRLQYATKEARMTAFTLKNIPDPLHKNLQQLAEQHHRSVSQEMIDCLQYAVTARKINAEQFLNDVRKLRKTVKGFLTAKNLRHMIEKGRE